MQALEERDSSMKKDSQERGLTVMMLVVAFTFIILKAMEDTVT
jgi:hypothetical protein